MANLNETTTWENGIYQWETTDPAQGGAAGIMNTPTRQLANRTNWLKSRIGGYDGVVTQDAVDLDPVSATSLNKFVIVNNTDPNDIGLTLPNGVAGNTLGFYYNSAAVAGTFLSIGSVSLAVGDMVEFLYTGTNTQIVMYIRRANESDTINPVGSVIAMAADSPAEGYLAMNGATLSRTTYARLWAHAQASGMLAADATDKTNNPGKFGRGDGATTFTLPDVRGEFIRAWDNGRGIDAGRGIGTFQAQAIQSHTHSFTGNNRVGISNTAYGSNATVAANLLAGSPTTAPVSDSTGGTETRPRNTALLFCIKF